MNQTEVLDRPELLEDNPVDDVVHYACLICNDMTPGTVAVAFCGHTRTVREFPFGTSATCPMCVELKKSGFRCQHAHLS